MDHNKDKRGERGRMNRKMERGSNRRKEAVITRDGGGEGEMKNEQRKGRKQPLGREQESEAEIIIIIMQ